MNSQNQYEEEIYLHDLWKAIVKRKMLIIGLFIISLLSVSIITFNMPKIYRGDVVLMINTFQKTNEPVTNVITAKEIVGIIGKINNEKKAIIFPKTHQSLTDVKLQYHKDSLDKIQVIIESKNREIIMDALTELTDYIKNNPIMKRTLENQIESLQKQSEELTTIIQSSEKLAETYKQLLYAGKLNLVGFNPIELNEKILELKIKKLNIDKFLEHFKVVENATPLFISKNPVKPKKALSITIAGLIGLLVGTIIALCIEGVKRE